MSDAIDPRPPRASRPGQVVGRASRAVAGLAMLALAGSLVPLTGLGSSALRGGGEGRGQDATLGSGCAGPVTSNVRVGPRPTLPPTPAPTRRPGVRTPRPGRSGPPEEPSPAPPASAAPRPSPGDPPASGTPTDAPVPSPGPAVSEQPAPTPEPEPTRRPTEPPEPTHRPTDPPEPTEAPPRDDPTPGPDGGEEPSPDLGGGARTGRSPVALGGAGVYDARPASAVPGIAPPPAPSPPPATSRSLGAWIREVITGLYQLLLWVIVSRPDGPDTVPGPDVTPRPAATGQPAAGGPGVAGPPRYGRVGASRVAGIDVSHWNGLVPFGLVRDVGSRFVLMKATQGTTFVDPAFRRHLASARAAGLLVGPYHFFDYRIGGRAQADHLLDTLARAGGSGRSLPPVVDVECFAPFGAADQAFVRIELRAFVGRIYQRTGRLPMVYTSWYMWRAVTGGDGSFGDLPLWVACWRCARPALPTGWDDWDFWQTGSIVIDATGDRLGSDVFGGTAADLRRWYRPMRARR